MVRQNAIRVRIKTIRENSRVNQACLESYVSLAKMLSRNKTRESETGLCSQNVTDADLSLTAMMCSSKWRWQLSTHRSAMPFCRGLSKEVRTGLIFRDRTAAGISEPCLPSRSKIRSYDDRGRIVGSYRSGIQPCQSCASAIALCLWMARPYSVEITGGHDFGEPQGTAMNLGARCNFCVAQVCHFPTAQPTLESAERIRT